MNFVHNFLDKLNVNILVIWLLICFKPRSQSVSNSTFQLVHMHKPMENIELSFAPKDIQSDGTFAIKEEMGIKEKPTDGRI